MSDEVAVDKPAEAEQEESKAVEHVESTTNADATASPSSAPTTASAGPRSKRMFIGQMAFETTDATMHREMSKFGQVTDCIVMKEKMTGRSRGFGFVSFADVESVDKLLAAVGKEEGLSIDGRRIAATVADARDMHGARGDSGKSGRDARDVRDVRDVRGGSRDVRSGGGATDVRDVRDRAGPARSYNDKSRHYSGRSGVAAEAQLDSRFPDDRGTDSAGVPLQRRKLFIGNVSHATTQQQYEEYFSQYGKVEDAVIIMDMATGKRKGFGFVTYTTSEAADRARHAGRFQYLVDRTVEVKPAIPPDEIAKLDAERAARERGGRGGSQEVSSSRERYRRSRSPPTGNYRRGGGGGGDARDRDQRRRYSRSRSRSADRYGGAADQGAAAAMDPNAMMQQYMMFMQMMQAQTAGMGGSAAPMMPGYNPMQPAMPYPPNTGYGAPQSQQQPSPMMNMPPVTQQYQGPPPAAAADPSQQYTTDAYMQAYQQWMQSQQQPQQTSAQPPMHTQQQHQDPQFSAMQSQLSGLGSYLNQLNDPQQGGPPPQQPPQQTYGQYNQMQHQQQPYR